MSFEGHLAAIEPSECAHLLRTGLVGRVGWVCAAGDLLIFPVNYLVVDGDIFFTTSVDSALAELATPTRVAFQVDEHDEETANGWTILVQGNSAAAEADLPIPTWAPGKRTLNIKITPVSYSGRSIAAGQNDTRG